MFLFYFFLLIFILTCYYHSQTYKFCEEFYVLHREESDAHLFMEDGNWASSPTRTSMSDWSHQLRQKIPISQSRKPSFHQGLEKLEHRI